ncbi:kynurenine formamidase [[Candida] jaroonii]|uniref:Kynurenine formamidase n=1 Tax=[Candida] jaroonii TaxID=467808 RepID=A0ACA9Y5B0_9ASCO|nr:kynurenine formamidase [[Candida] jaroonii]
MYHYGSHELQQLKVFKRVNKTTDTVVFLHGGGWRDPNNTLNDFEPLMKDFNDINVISMNYRLSPKANTDEELKASPPFQHPRHLIDVIHGMKFIVEKLKLNIVSMVGHSVGSSLILQLLNYDIIIKNGLPSKGPEEITTEGFEFLESMVLKNVYLLDGIFDVWKLLEEYPDYRFFTRCAFEDDDHMKQAFQISLDIKPCKLMNEETVINVVYSLEDELISIKQSELLVEFLKKWGIKYEFLTGNWGAHEEIYRRSEISSLILKGLE